MLYKVVLSFSVTIQMKATEQYVSVVLLLSLYKMALSFESVGCRVIIQMTGSCAGIAYYALQVFFIYVRHCVATQMSITICYVAQISFLAS